MTTTPLRPSPEIADLIAAPEFRELHARHVAAAPDAVWAALHEVRGSDLPITGLLMRVRAPLARRRPAETPFWRALPIPVVHEDEPRYALAAGIGRPWTPTGSSLVRDAAGVAGFHEPGWAKLATDFRLVPTAAGTLLTTETRVVTTDPVSRARFRAYWTLIRPFSGVVRHEMLRAVERVATASTSERRGSGRRAPGHGRAGSAG